MGSHPSKHFLDVVSAFRSGAVLCWVPLLSRSRCFSKRSRACCSTSNVQSASLIVKTKTADDEFDKAITEIRLLGGTAGTEPSSSKEQVELFCLNGHKLALEEVGRQIAEQCDAVEARRLRRAQLPTPPTSVTRP